MVDPVWTAVITAAATCLATLIVTLIFNKVTGLPKQVKKQKDDYNAQMEKISDSINTLDERLSKVEESVGQYPKYRAQSLEIQSQLRSADTEILDVCNVIKNDVIANRQMLDERLKSLESREKNALRAKILDEYRLYTDIYKNPRQAWTEMEHHSFFELIKDYESLGGNDYVHNTIIPAMNELDVVYMDDLKAVKDLFNSRNADSKCVASKSTSKRTTKKSTSKD